MKKLFLSLIVLAYVVASCGGNTEEHSHEEGGHEHGEGTHEHEGETHENDDTHHHQEEFDVTDTSAAPTDHHDHGAETHTH